MTHQLILDKFPIGYLSIGRSNLAYFAEGSSRGNQIIIIPGAVVSAEYVHNYMRVIDIEPVTDPAVKDLIRKYDGFKNAKYFFFWPD